MKARFDRKFYIPADIRNNPPLEYPEGNCILYLYEINRLANRPAAIGFIGEQSKPAFNYTFPTHKQRDIYIARWLDGCRQSVEHRAKRATDRQDAAKIAASCFKVGDILYSSWGYDQTNIDFYQVTRTRGKQVFIRELQQRDTPTETGFMCAECVPVPGKFQDEPEKMHLAQCWVDNNGKASPYLHLTSYSHATPWDGRPMGYSWGH